MRASRHLGVLGAVYTILTLAALVGLCSSSSDKDADWNPLSVAASVSFDDVSPKTPDHVKAAPPPSSKNKAKKVKKTFSDTLTYKTIMKNHSLSAIAKRRLISHAKKKWEQSPKTNSEAKEIPMTAAEKMAQAKQLETLAGGWQDYQQRSQRERRQERKLLRDVKAETRREARTHADMLFEMHEKESRMPYETNGSGGGGRGGGPPASGASAPASETKFLVLEDRVRELEKDVTDLETQMRIFKTTGDMKSQFASDTIKRLLDTAKTMQLAADPTITG